MERRSASTTCRSCIVKIKRIPLSPRKLNTSAKFQTRYMNKEINHQSKKHRSEASQFEPVQSSSLAMSNSRENIKSKKNLQPLPQKELQVRDSHSTVNYSNNQLLSALEKKALNLVKQKENINPKELVVNSTERKTVSVNSSVYEFSSQMSPVAKNVHRARDVIKKLVKNDKVVINYKRKVRSNIQHSKVQKISVLKCPDKIELPYLAKNINPNYGTIKQCTSMVLTNVLNKQTKQSDLQNNRAKQLLHIVRNIINAPKEKDRSRNHFLDSNTIPIAEFPTLSSDNTNRALKGQCSTLKNLRISGCNNLLYPSFKKVITPSNTRQNTLSALCNVQSRNSQNPLKKVNILEVIHLPSWNKKTTFAESVKKNNKSAPIAQKSPALYTDCYLNLKSSDKSTLFGFEEYLSNSILNDSSKSYKVYEVPQKTKKSLNDKLKELSKWRPNIICKDSLIRKGIHMNEKPSNLEDDKNVDTNNLKEILCSTMIRQKPFKKLYTKNLDELECSNAKINQRDLNYIFADPTLKKDFIKLQKRFKTYDKPQNHKGFKEGRNNFLNTIKGFENTNSTLQTGNDFEIVQKEKRIEHQKNPELEEFAKNFNKECEEVEQYPLIIEKSNM